MHLRKHLFSLTCKYYEFYNMFLILLIHFVYLSHTYKTLLRYLEKNGRLNATEDDNFQQTRGKIKVYTYEKNHYAFWYLNEIYQKLKKYFQEENN